MKIHFGIKLLLYVFMFMLFLCSSQAFVKSDYLKLIDNSEKCSSNCYQIYRFYKLPNMSLDKFTSMDLTLKDKSLTSYKATDINKEDISKSLIVNEKTILYDFGMYYYTSEIVDVSADKYCEIKSNNSFYVCGTEIKKELRNIWKPFSFKELYTALSSGADNSYIDVKFTGKLTKGNSVDIVLSYAGFSYDEYALWNFSAPYIRWDFEQNTTDMGGYYNYNGIINGTGTQYSNQKFRINSYSLGIDTLSSVNYYNTNIGGATNDWAIGAWFYFNSTSGNRWLFCNGIAPAGDTNSVCLISIGANVNYDRPAVADIDTGQDIVAGVWEHWILARNGTHYSVLRNGTLVYTSSAESTLSGNNDIAVGNNWWDKNAGLNGFVDNIIIINRTITQQDMADMMSNVTAPPVVPSYFNNTFVSKVPNDLNFSNVFTRINITYNIVQAKNLNFSYKTNTSINDIHKYINGVAYSGWTTITDYSLNSSYNIQYTLDDNDVLQGNYPINFRDFQNTIHSVYNMDLNSKYYKLKVQNMSKNLQYSFFEVYAYGTTNESNLNIYYCNSSYSTSLDYCSQIASISPSTAFNHNHRNPSHYIVPLPLNTTTGKVNDIGATETSYFILTAKGWDLTYISNNSGTLQYSNNNGATYSNISTTIDYHIHQFSTNYTENSTFYYYSCVINEYSGVTDCSALKYDTFELEKIAPSQPIIIHPRNEFITSATSSYTIEYQQSISLYGTMSTYNITLLNSTKGLKEIIKGNNGLALSYVWNTSNISSGMYYVRVTACDTDNLCSYDENNFTFSNYSIAVNYPDNGTAFNQSSSRYVDFNMTITGTGTTINCSLYINETLINSKEINFNENSYIRNINRIGTGNQTFYFNCSNIISSEKRTINMIDDINFTFSYSAITGLNNATITFYFSQPAWGKLSINNMSLNNTINGYALSSSLTITGLEDDTTYLYDLYASSDLDTDYEIKNIILRTKSYTELNYNLEALNTNYMFLIIVGIFLFLLYILSEIFRLEMLGVLSGIGFIIFSFTFIGTGWLFILILFSGVVIFARSVLAWLW